MKVFPLKILLWIGAAFFLFEALLHGFGLPILEHDKIFLPTHDRYIALFALTYAVLLFLVTTNFKKYDLLFKLLMGGIFLAIMNAAIIAYTGGYVKFFPVVVLDEKLGRLGIGAVVWYILTWFFYCLKK